MLDSIYIGMSGLASYTKGLTNISNNVSNLNTPGFKSSRLGFMDLYYRHEYSAWGLDGFGYAAGNGVGVGSTSLKFSQGEFRQTGNNLDAAVDGNGLFVVKKDGQTFYTRDGEFKIDDAGYLVASSDGARVEGFSSGALADISINGLRSNPAQPTQNVKFINSLSTSATTAAVQNIPVYDSLGVKHMLTLNLTKDPTSPPIRWTYNLLEGSTTLTSGEVQYSAAGTVVPGTETHSFSFNPGNGASTNSVTLDFSDSSYLSTSSSTLSVGSSDGYGAGYLTKETFDTDGYLVLSYSNGQTAKGAQLALAWFSNPDVLSAQGGNRYTASDPQHRVLGVPGSHGLGSLKTGGVELSNVDLTNEFSDLIIIQRGYQASSQVLTAANEMIQQLGDIRGRR